MLSAVSVKCIVTLSHCEFMEESCDETVWKSCPLLQTGDYQLLIFIIQNLIAILNSLM